MLHALYSGCFAAGKSRAICVKCYTRARNPGAREGLARKARVSLVKSTLKTLLEPGGINHVDIPLQDGTVIPAGSTLPPVIPPGTYTHNKTEGEIKLHGGGTIVYFGLDDPSKIGSMELSGCGIDELTEFTPEDYDMLTGRVRRGVEGVIPQLYSATNPNAPSHWVAVRWGLAAGHTPMEGYAAIETEVADNWMLDPRYVESLEQFTGTYYERMVKGRWVGAQGLVYDNFRRAVHVKTVTDDPHRALVLVDDGVADPFVALRVEADPDGRWHVAKEVYQSGLELHERVRAVRELGGQDATVVYDSAAATLGQELTKAFPDVVASNKTAYKRPEGCQLVRKRFGPGQDGRPRLTIDPGCVKTLTELEGYEWKRGRDGRVFDVPQDFNDHAMDALRYGVVYDETKVEGGVWFV